MIRYSRNRGAIMLRLWFKKRQFKIVFISIILLSYIFSVFLMNFSTTQGLTSFASEYTTAPIIPANFNQLSTLTSNLAFSLGSSRESTSIGTISKYDIHSLANSPWPMYQNNPQHTGLSPYNTSNNQGGMIWRHYFGVSVWVSFAIDSNNVIYVNPHDSHLYAINGSTGSLLWDYSLGGGSSKSTPAIGSDGTIYVGIGDGLTAVSQSGGYKWHYPAADVFESSPAIGDDGTIYASSRDGYLHAIWPNGTQRWKFKLGTTTRSSPAIGTDGTIYICSGDGYLYAIWPNGTQRWKFQTGNNAGASPAIGSDGTIYIGSDDTHLYAIWPNGTLKWKFQLNGLAGVSPAIGSDGTIYIGTSESTLYAIQPNGTLKWRFTADSAIRFAPVISSDGIIYFSINYYLYSLWSNGTLRWKFQTSGVIQTSPVIGINGTVYIGTADGYLYAIGGDKINNNPPILENAKTQINQEESNRSEVTFSITYTDLDNDPPTKVMVYIDQMGYEMSKATSSDKKYTDGCIYSLSITLDEGVHSYFFVASDGLNTTRLPHQPDEYYTITISPGNLTTNPPSLPFQNPYVIAISIFAGIFVTTTLFIKRVRTKSFPKSEEKREKKSTIEKEVPSRPMQLYEELYAKFLERGYDLEYLRSLDASIRRDFALWLSDKLIAEGKHELAKDILIEIGEYEKAIPILISLAVYNKAQGNIEKAKEMYELAAELYRKVGDIEKAKEIENHIKSL